MNKTNVALAELETVEIDFYEHEIYAVGKLIASIRYDDELWDNDPKTYYWRCGDGVKYWSVKEAAVALSRVAAVQELPKVIRELVAA